MHESADTRIPYLSERDVAAVLDWEPLIDALEDAMTAFSAGKVAQPVRQLIPVPGHDGIIAAMPAAGETMGVKVVTLYHENAGTGVPTHQAIVALFDVENGSPLAVMDGRLITEMRTAAGSAAAARRLATCGRIRAVLPEFRYIASSRGSPINGMRWSCSGATSDRSVHG